VSLRPHDAAALQ